MESKGYGFVTFKDPQAAMKFLEVWGVECLCLLLWVVRVVRVCVGLFVC